MPIKILAPEVVAQIAAGEVVERPASVVKELVENSLDAAASQIAVEVRGGGVSLIRVSDNGVGIAAAELELVFQRYATSKIASLADLESIASLGFRGEALPSIAAVAEVDIISGTSGQAAANYLNLKEGIVVSRGSQGRSQGTTLSVRHLFRNVPARLKFLKSPATENSHIASVVSQYALAFPEVKFTLSLDGRTVLRTAGSGQLMDSVIELYGLEVAGNMLAVNSGDKGWQGEGAASLLLVTGLVGSPAISRSTRGYLSFFVNRRWVSSRLLAWAVEEAYHGLLMTGKHPVAIINISLAAKEVDVNIHPAKSEVKFQDERLVFTAVQKAVRRALIELAPAPRIEEIATTYTAPAASGRVLSTSFGAGYRPATQSPLAPTPLALSLPALRLLGQLASSYIVAEGADGLYLIDQHAAHERILFEQIKHQVSHRGIEVQGLLEPVTLEVNPQQDAVLKARYEKLAEFGFLIEPFGDRSYLVRTVPALLHQKDWGGVLRELGDSSLGEERGDWLEKLAISIACHSAV
ncbi:MAG: DNA mismatch repair endonuclease MutL, partial [Chloroflexi bacterium]|nr:DNA mismatch repair endonuclease MutL [Chloroflexota bacterium]